MAGGTPANPATLAFSRSAPDVPVGPVQAQQQQRARENDDCGALHGLYGDRSPARPAKSVDFAT